MITSLSLLDFRVLSAEYTFAPGLNIILGNNGSGKSSLLEALHFLAFSRSFRASTLDKAIAHNKESFLLQANISLAGMVHQVALMRTHGKTLARHHGDAARLGEIAKLSPALFMDSDSHRHYFSTSAHRRRLFDWLVFHVKHPYMTHVKKYNAALKRRNAALKTGQETAPWDEIMISESQYIHSERQAVFEKVKDLVVYRDAALLYSPGYDVNEGLRETLRQNLPLDRIKQRTSEGPHRADWQFFCNDRPAADVLSQGQQKLLFLHLLTAHQAVMQKCGVEPFVMIDDLAAELDDNARSAASRLLSGANQTFVSAIREQDLDGFLTQGAFHVKHLEG